MADRPPLPTDAERPGGHNAPPTARGLFGGFMREFKRPLTGGVVALAITDLTDILPPLVIKAGIDSLEKGTTAGNLAGLAGILIGLSILQGFGRFFWRRFFLGTSHEAVFRLRGRLYDHLQTLPASFFTRTRTGDLMSRLTNDLDEVRMMMGFGILLFADALFYFLSVPFLMLWLSPRLTFFLLIPLPFIPFYVFRIGRMIHERSERVQERIADLSAKAQESIAGVRVIKGFGREQADLGLFNAISSRLVHEKLRLAKVESVFDPSLDFIIGIGIGALILIGGHMVIAGTLTIGSFIAFQTYLMKMVWPMTAVGMTSNLYQRGMASLGRCAELLAETPEEAQKHAESPGIPPKAAPIPQVISVRNLTFTYPKSNHPALRGVSFSLRAGQTLGIVGPIGSGKTTLLMALLRLVPPPPGSIFLDDTELLELPPHATRALFGYVPQDHFLFSESLRENILFGRDDKNNQALAADCAAVAGIAPDIEALPFGYDTFLGERGVNLSGGQKQRVSLARALAVDPAILLLDDATSAVDTDTEERVLHGVRSRRSGRTTIIVSHRLVSVQHADLILLLDNGEIRESGTHQELLGLGGAYARLWARQRLRTELEALPPRNPEPA
jgi:ATP-binding cassette, subfamily B, multidrug efflux pump